MTRMLQVAMRVNIQHIDALQTITKAEYNNDINRLLED